MPACDGQTDGQRTTAKTAICRAINAQHRAGKNKKLS